MQHHDDRDRDDERHRVQHRVGDAEQVERLLQQMRHRRFADPAQQDRADRDAQLRAGQHQRQVLAGADHGDRAVLALLGEGLEPVAARRDQRELRADEERVGAEQQHGQQHAEKVAHQRPPSSVPAVAAQLGQLEQIDAAAVHPHHRGQPADRVVAVARRDRTPVSSTVSPAFGDVAELLQHQTADGLVFALGRPESGRVGHLVDAQQPRHLPAVAGRHHIGCGFVVFVADVADDLLDQVLDRDHAGGAAVFVDHQRGLQPVGPDLRHHVVAVQRRGHHRDRLRQIGQPGRGALGRAAPRRPV